MITKLWRLGRYALGRFFGPNAPPKIIITCSGGCTTTVPASGGYTNCIRQEGGYI
jgi:hypothetical protein